MAPLHIRDLPSPNHDARPSGVPIDTLILHYTGMRSGQAAIDRLRDPQARVSSHYVVEEDGAVFRLVAEDRRAWHAGASWWRGNSELNASSIGIEIVNPGHEWGYRDFRALQMAAACDLCLEILARHPIPPATSWRTATWHRTASRTRGSCSTGTVWRGTASGCGRTASPTVAPAARLRDAAALRPVRHALASIGYQVAPDGPLDKPLAAVLCAFQRHWRPEAITGEADAGTQARLFALLRAIETAQP